MSSPAPPELPIRFELDPRAERDASIVRGAAAAILIVAGFWTLLLPFTVPRMVALAGLIFAGLWLLRAHRDAVAAQHPHEHFLELAADGLTRGEPGEVTTLPWQQLRGLELDEDRLVIRLHPAQGPPIVIEPRYHGIDLYDLRDLIAETWKAASPGALEPSPPGTAGACTGAQDD
ncbi:MAG: hypothetical protein PVI30_05815 [Myxococcales bacterium]